MSNIKRKLKKYQSVGIVVLCLALTVFLGLKGFAFLSDYNLFETPPADESTIKEGPLSKVVLEAGPFDIHRHYLSMEGPWTSSAFTAKELLASKNISLPEGMVDYIENGGPAAGMSGAPKPAESKGRAKPEGVVKVPKQPRELYWFKGVKLEVLDENGKVQPTAEFICHWNLDVDPAFRNKVFKEGHPTVNPRLSSVSQGETLQILPPGFGVPIASDEPLDIVFQAANRTSDVHRRVKHRCTLYFVKDKELVYPIKALYCHVPYTCVVVDKNVPEITSVQKRFCPICVGTSEGVDAPNDRAGGTFPDNLGRKLSGHWVIPPGVHTYRDIIGNERDEGFSRGNPVIRAAWTHVHPLCTKLSLVENLPDKRTVVLSTDCRTRITPGLQIMHLGWLTPKGGVKLKEEATYELEVTYNNVLNKAVDSMASMGIYMQDDTFARPKWALADYNPDQDLEAMASAAAEDQDKATLMSCAIPKVGSNASSITPNDTTDLEANPHEANRKTLPLFDVQKDGPYLTKPEKVELVTTRGPITIVLDPKLAPKTATHLYTLMSNGAFAGTPFYSFQNNFLVLAQAVNKFPGQKFLNRAQLTSLRRLPLEVDSGGRHNQLALSLCRDEEDVDSATSSFCIVLERAHHLDGHYTIFGHVEQDPKTLATLKAIEDHWSDKKARPYIVTCRLTRS
jgi:cyclophilin family peptidyl-prolyl cis-trans isomerase